MKTILSIIAAGIAGFAIGSFIDAFWDSVNDDGLRYTVGAICLYFAFFHKWRDS